jgi:hypothetical protein
MSKKIARNTRKSNSRKCLGAVLFTLKFWMEDGSAALKNRYLY